VEDALEVRIAHADSVHVIERFPDVVHARPARADALRDQACAPVQIELADVGRMFGVGNESERAHHAAPGQTHRNQPWRVYAPIHLALPQAGERATRALRVDAVRHSPARTALAKAHHQARLCARAAIARGEDAQCTVVAVRAAESPAGVAEARRPHQRAVAEDPQVAFRQLRGELGERHFGATI
jgi:hypothetical protein